LDEQRNEGRGVFTLCPSPLCSLIALVSQPPSHLIRC
jgi:hypothetical protein